MLQSLNLPLQHVECFDRYVKGILVWKIYPRVLIFLEKILDFGWRSHAPREFLMHNGIETWRKLTKMAIHQRPLDWMINRRSSSSCDNLDLVPESLAQQKKQARKKLLSLEPEIAQKQVNQTLYPQLWEHDPEANPWDESIPTSYGETDP